MTKHKRVTRSARGILLTVIAGIALVVITGCNGEDQVDAYGNFQATETTVSAQASGQLVAFTVEQGKQLHEGEVVGLVDTTQLALQRNALLAQRQSLLSQRQATLSQQPEIGAQVGALQAQLQTAEEELARTRRLYENQAATARELNQREGEVAVLRQQIEGVVARTGTVREQASSVAAQVKQIDAQVAEIEERIRKAEIVNPVSGTVMTRLARRGEIVAPGSPLYTVADLDTLELRAYATGAQLPLLRIGMPVEVLYDNDKGGVDNRHGIVSWVSSDAEFTPNQIQTRDERASLVYAFEVLVPNPGGELKVGMPGEVRFNAATTLSESDL